MLGLALLSTIWLVVACSHPAPPRQPSPATQADVERAETALRRRDYDVARAAYQQAIDRAPDVPSQAYARRELASMLILIRELDGAAAELDRVTRLEPGDPQAWHDLGVVRHALGDDDGAIVALGQARRLRPDDARPRIALAALYWSRGDRARATAEYQALLDLDLPDRVREKVQWALRELARPPPSGPPAAPPAPR